MKSIIELVIENEGGYENLYFSDGTHTKCGITWEYNEKFFNSCGIFESKGIELLSNKNIDKFYMHKFTKNRVYDLPFGLGYQFLDHLINAGRTSAVKILQRSINLNEILGLLKVDGQYGPKTKKLVELCKNDPEVCEIFKLLRKEDYIDKFLVKSKKNISHAMNCFKSWRNRIEKRQKA